MPLSQLTEEFSSIQGYFFNPNIQPYKEYERRLGTLQNWAATKGLPLVAEEYNPTGWLRTVAYSEAKRCRICYDIRLNQAARQARKLGCPAFTSTLLYSIYQNREQIVLAGRRAGEQTGVNFLEYDFRALWKEGQLAAQEQQLYRQPYCGCIYSEAQRYLKRELDFSLPNGEQDGIQSS